MPLFDEIGWDAHVARSWWPFHIYENWEEIWGPKNKILFCVSWKNTWSTPHKYFASFRAKKKQKKHKSSNSSNSSTIREKWNIFIASDSPAAKVPGARASRYRVYGVIGLHIGNYPNYPSKFSRRSVVFRSFCLWETWSIEPKHPQTSFRLVAAANPVSAPLLRSRGNSYLVRSARSVSCD